MQTNNGKENELMEVEEVAVSDGGAARFAAVDVKSGEEKYNTVWEATCKLSRFDEGENQWKERGQGNAKILQRIDNNGEYMFVFRREAIGKLAAQHYLLKGMIVNVHRQNEKLVTWRTMKDYTDDEEGFPESFLMRFTSKEDAEAAVKEMQSAIGKSSA